MSAAIPLSPPSDEVAIRAALSIPRTDTYVRATAGDTARAVSLYGWNARVSAALMLPAHFAEVTTRNAVSEALTTVYGANWPWNSTFVNSLPTPGGRTFKPRRELQAVAAREPTTGKVIAELKFAFWQHMFTSRYDVRLWAPHIMTLFPHAAGLTVPVLRARIHDDLDTIRALRNRIAHHEPVITRNLGDDLACMLDLVELRSPPTATWVRSMEQVTAILPTRP